MVGVRRHPWGLEAYVKVLGKQFTRCFPLGTPAKDLRQWRAQTRKSELEHRQPGRRGTLAQCIDRYLQSLTGKTRTDAAQWLRPWRERYGDKRRHQVTREMMRDTLNELSAHYATSSLNHFRTYLINVWRFHDGRAHSCPMLDIPKFDEPKAQPRWIDPTLLERAFNAIPRDSATKARLMLAWATAARPCEIMMIEPPDFHLDDTDANGRPSPWVYVRGRKDCDDRAVPLNSFGVRAVRLFQQTNAYGTYSTPSARKIFLRACERANIGDAISLVEGIYPSGRKRWRVTPYVLRHTALTELRRRGADLADVQAIAGHKLIETTRRYSPTVHEKLVRAMRAIDRPATAAPPPNDAEPTASRTPPAPDA